MRTLTDVFAPGMPLLPEGLRTLDVSPARSVEPGQTVQATFRFRNLGGGVAKGLRVRFRLPEGLTYLVGTAAIDGKTIDEDGGLTTLLQSSGAEIGDIPPNAERRIELAYSVVQTIENGTPITLQAAISSFDVSVIGSNVVRLVVRSRPQLNNPLTKLSAASVNETAPGQEIAIKAQVHNAGQSSAHDVIVLLPVPANSTYVAESARINGRPAALSSENDPFGMGRPLITVPTLATGGALEVTYRVRIDALVDDATPIVVRGALSSQETPEFALKPVTLNVSSAPSFAGDAAGFAVEANEIIEPGERVRLVVSARNAGSERARGLAVKITLPDGIVYSAASRTIDGAAAIDAGTQPGLFAIGDLDPGHAVEVALCGVVSSPQADGRELRFGATLVWSKGKREFDVTKTVGASARFPATFNRVVRESPRMLQPGDPFAAAIAIANMGTDIATDARLALDVDDMLDHVRVLDGENELVLGDDRTVYLESLAPNTPRLLRVEARLADAIDDQYTVRLKATLRTAKLMPVEIGSVAHVVASRPHFSPESRLAVATNTTLRPNRTIVCRLSLVNDGSDGAHDVRARLQLPDELRLEHVEGQVLDGNHIVFGTIPAGASAEAEVHLRLIATIGNADVLEVSTRVVGINVVPFSLAPLTITTFAEASFTQDASLTPSPEELIEAGAELTYTLSLRNSGDGTAKRLTMRIDTPANTVYAPSSTTLNEVSLLDYHGTSPLFATSGLMLADVGPGVAIVARLRVIVNTPLLARTAIETRAYITWDEAEELTISAEPVHVRSQAAFQLSESSLPFAVVNASAGPPARTASPAIAGGDDLLQLPPASPSSRRNGDGRSGAPTGWEATADAETPLDAEFTEHALARHAAKLVTLELSADRLEWMVRFLREATAPGLVPHLLVLRALFPSGADNADAVMRARFRRHTELLSETIDQLFVKMRLPNATLVPEDLETKELRTSLRGIVDGLRRERDVHADARDGLWLVGDLRAEELTAAQGALGNEPLMTATPWLALSLVMGTRLERDGVVYADFGAYREALQQTLAGMGRLAPVEFTAALAQPVEALDVLRVALIDALGEQQLQRA